VNTFWLIAAGLIVVIAVAVLFVWLPKLRKVQKEALHDPEGVMAILVGSQAPLIVGGIAVVLFAGALYFAWTKSGSHSSSQVAQNSQMAPEHIEMIKTLSARLEKDPNDGKGWAMLARSYAVLGRYNEALPAYEKAASLVQNDPVLLVDYADVLALVNGKNLQGKPLEIIQSALMMDPNNIKALNLSGSAAFQAGDYTHAVGYWEKLLKLLPPDSPSAKQVNNSIASAHAREVGKPAQGAQSGNGGAQISGEVRLSPELASKAAPTDTVFVFAKAASGPPMPIIVIRSLVKDLPQKFTLDDSMAMSPTMKLSSFKEVVVGAKISKSGSAKQQSGDLRGEVAAVKVGTTNVQLVIDKVAP
jgi:cytochrome c-type biogenesis protein CcmH